MPRIYLSPSTQEKNQYVNGGNEEQYMNLIADALEPYLRSSGIQFTRNTPQMTAASSIQASNAGSYDLHLALHSNAAPVGKDGTVQGSEVYYDPRSTQGKRAADITVENLKKIYPDPNRVRAISTRSLGEVDRTKAPAILIEFAYHDNPADAQWIKDNIKTIARTVAQSVTQYLGVPFVEPMKPRRGRVETVSGPLNIRSRPSTSAQVVASAPKGAELTVLGEWQGWDVVEYRGQIGYAAADYIQLL